MKYTKEDLNKHMTSEMCTRFRENPNVNPLTGYTISKNGDIYKKLMKHCDKFFPKETMPSRSSSSVIVDKSKKRRILNSSISLPSTQEMRSSSPTEILVNITSFPKEKRKRAASKSASPEQKPKTKRVRKRTSSIISSDSLPIMVGNRQVPLSPEAWESYLKELEDTVIKRHIRYRFLYKDDVRAIEDDKRMLEKATVGAKGITPTLLDRIDREIRPAIVEILSADVIVPTPLDELYNIANNPDHIESKIEKIIDDILDANLQDRADTKLMVKDQIHDSKEIIIKIDEILYNGIWHTIPPNLQEKIDFLSIILGELELIRANPQDNMYDETVPNKHGSIPSSSTREVQSDSSRDRKYSSSYKRNSILSLMSPIAEDLAPLPKKTRQQLLKEIRAACRDLRDNISLERFDRMKKKKLYLVVRVSKDADNKHNCYYVGNLYKYWRQRKDDHLPFVNPANRSPITKEEEDEIMAKMRYIKRNVRDPRTSIKVMDASPKIRFRPDSRITVGEDGKERIIRFKKLELIRSYGSHTSIVQEIGYIPTDIEPSDISNQRSLDMSSAVLEHKIVELHEKKKLLIRNTIPYRCCRVKLENKSMDYWIDRRNPKGIRMDRVVATIQEIDDALRS